MPIPVERITSGGQTGVDRGALVAALNRGFPCGGWCPAGRRAEDGVIPEIYPLSELGSSGYRGRTLRNVLDSDGSTIIYFGDLSGGTRLTASYCRAENRPYLLIDAHQTPTDEAARQIAAFVEEYSVVVLNVAGPRASGHPAGHSYAREAITRLLRIAATEVTG